MNEKEIIKELQSTANKLGACSKLKLEEELRGVSRLFFSPQGREFCEKNNFPALSMFQQMKKYGIAKYGVFVDEGDVCRSNDKDIALVGDTCGELIFDENNVVHKIILMHGAKARIKASNYSVLLIVNIGGCKVGIEKDKTVRVL